ncbi:MAG: hypothetical protein MJZ20_03130 [Bacteroidaceae bacterium]|nr:hypothetical protein [Bacteroidaceae bacterium]
MYDDFMKRMARQGKHNGEVYKRQSDMIMDATFKNDIAYRKCYILKNGATFPEQTLAGYKKAKAVCDGRDLYRPDHMSSFAAIDAKYAVHSYYSINGDNVDYYLQFRPLAHGLDKNIRVGAYVFVPDDLGRYNLWMIVAKDDKPQFPQFYILKCNMLLKWYIGELEVPHYEGLHVDTGTYYTWAIQRTQSSYNSGVWTDYLTTSVENQTKAITPTNNDTLTITYNERFVISNNPLRRVAWEVSKVEDTTTLGLTKLTFTQQLEFDQLDNRSWVNYTSDNYSDCQTGIAYDFYCPRSNDLVTHDYSDVPILGNGKITHSGLKSSLKIGGNFKTYTATFLGYEEPENIRPLWNIEYYYDNTSIFLPFDFDGDQLIVDGDDSFIHDGDMFSYVVDGETVFAVEAKYDPTRKNQLQVRCPRIVSMVGNICKIRALYINPTTHLTTTLEIEVEVDA